MYKLVQLIIITGFCLFASCFLFFHIPYASVADAIVILDGVEKTAYCFLESQIIEILVWFCLMFLFLGVFWGEFLTLKYPAKKSNTNKI